MTDVRDCGYPWNGFMPMSEGHVLCCCYGSLPVGILSETSPEGIWNGPTMRSLRASLSAGVVHSVCQKSACKFVMGSRTSGEPPAPGPVSTEGFDEGWYVAAYFDVRHAIHLKRWSSGLDHYLKEGHREFRFRNEAEWKVWADADRAKAAQVEKAKLTWEVEPRREGEHVLLRFRAVNEGSAPWEPGKVRACAWIMPRLLTPEFSKELGQAGLPNTVEPGESCVFSLVLPVALLPPERSFAIVDLVSSQRFSESLTRPLIIAISADASGELKLWATGVAEPRALRRDAEAPSAE